MFQHRLGAVARRISLATAGLALAGAVACAPAEPSAQPAPVQAPASAADQPQSLPREALTVHTTRGPVAFKVQVADTDQTREKGLMFVRKMADDEGMIFDFFVEQPVAFWMRNTFIPLDMLFVDGGGRVVAVAQNAKPFDETPIPSGAPARTVIEINGGLAAKLGIRPGDRVTDERIYRAR